MKEEKSSQILYKKKRGKIRINMMKVKWTLQWLFVSIILSIVYLQRISANEAVTYIPALECNDRYGKPQVNICCCYCFFFHSLLVWYFYYSIYYAYCVHKQEFFQFFLMFGLDELKTVHINTFIQFRLSQNFPRTQHQQFY